MKKLLQVILAFFLVVASCAQKASTPSLRKLCSEAQAAANEESQSRYNIKPFIEKLSLTYRDSILVWQDVKYAGAGLLSAKVVFDTTGKMLSAEVSEFVQKSK